MALAAARAAGALILGASASRGAELKSSHHDLVTETDRACQAEIFAHIRAAFPAHAFLGEEDVPSGVAAAEAAIAERAAAVVYEPTRGEAFTALRGRGAALNGARMRVSGAAALTSAVAGFGSLGNTVNPDQQISA